MKKTVRFQDKESKFTGKYSKSVYWTVLTAFWKYRYSCSAFLILGFIARAILLSSANIIGFWADSLCYEKVEFCKEPPSIFLGFTHFDYFTLILASACIGFLFTIIFRVGFSRRSCKAVSTIYDEVTLRTSRQPMEFFDKTPTGRIVTRFSSDYGHIFRIFGGPLAEFITIIFDIIWMFIFITYASIYFLPICVLIVIVYFLVYRLNSNRIRTVRRDLSASRSPSIAHFNETSIGNSSIRVFSKQKTFFERFKFLNNQYLNQKMKTITFILYFSFQMGFLTGLLLLITTIIGYQLLQHDLIGVGAMGVAFTYITLSGTTLAMFFEWMAQFEEAMTGLERMDQYLQKPIEPGDYLPATTEFKTTHPILDQESEKEVSQSLFTPTSKVSIEFKNVSFQYREELPDILKDISFKVPPGKHLGIIGRTGSGKTTIIQALFHLYPHRSGEILLNQKSVDSNYEGLSEHKMSLKQFRDSMAYISQDPTILQGSLRENLSLKEDIDDEKLVIAIKQAGLYPWYKSLPRKLDTFIEEKGRNISSGQKQLISLARALIKETPIIVMDEATSSIDPHTEEWFEKTSALHFKNKTRITIAHRLTTVKNCDLILWLKDGKVQMIDAPERVIAQFLSI